MKIKAAIFDMDGTLVDSLMIWDFIWDEFSKAYLDGKSFRPSAADDKKVRTLTLREAMQLIHDNYGLGKSGEELLEHTNRIMIDFYANKVMMKAGAREFLESLKSRGIKTCLATATAKELLGVALKRCEIAEYFDAVFSCADIGKGKEYPDIFLLAQQFLGEDKSETWVFEDSLTALETASRAGFFTVGIYDRFNPTQEQVKEVATEYIAEGETLLRLLEE